MRIRRTDQRGQTKTDWLDSRHSFSFGEYVDPEWMGWSVLRVLNDDRVAPGGGFPRHGHQNMEIISYVLDGSIVHKDSTGNQLTLSAGELQHMSAGSGIHHSEANASTTEPLHFLQIWIETETDAIAPSYSQACIDPATLNGHFKPLVTSDGRGRTLKLRQDATLYAARLKAGAVAKKVIEPDRVGYLHVISGVIKLAGTVLAAGDGACLLEGGVTVQTVYDAHVLLFDLP